MRILLAEDDKAINRVIVRRLKWEGYSVDACFDGQEALDYLAAVEYDAVILDVMMPKVDGFEVLTQMRERGDKTPTLFLTVLILSKKLSHLTDMLLSQQQHSQSAAVS